VSFSLDENGIVNVTAEDKGSGNEENITIEGGAGLSDEQIEEMRTVISRHGKNAGGRQGKGDDDAN